MKNLKHSTRALLGLAILAIASSVYAANETPATESTPDKPVVTTDKAQTDKVETDKPEVSPNKPEEQAKPDEKTAKKTSDKFIPSEAISEDLAVSFPVDI